jgi:hypothetical protein
MEDLSSKYEALESCCFNIVFRYCTYVLIAPSLFSLIVYKSLHAINLPNNMKSKHDTEGE